MWLVQCTSWTEVLYLLSVIRTLIMFKKQMDRLSKGKDAHINAYLKAVQLSQNRTYEIFFASWNAKGRCEVMSLFVSKEVENSCIGTAKGYNIDVIYIRRNIATTIFTLYGPCQLWLHQYFLNAFTWQQGEMTRHIIHGIVGCLATSVAKVTRKMET